MRKGGDRAVKSGGDRAVRSGGNRAVRREVLKTSGAMAQGDGGDGGECGGECAAVFISFSHFFPTLYA